MLEAKGIDGKPPDPAALSENVAAEAAPEKVVENNIRNFK